jgi:glyoxylase-like metal-dependent hydrolase (beta-lactamase superfamily II)
MIDMNLQIESFFDASTGTASHVAYDAPGGCAAIIDPVLDFDAKSGRTHTYGADRIAQFVKEQGLKVEWILETHAHADHLSAAHHLRQLLGGQIAIGAHIRQVQKIFKKLYNLEPEFQGDGSQFDHLFEDGEIFRIGKLEARALAVPGHTPADMAYQIGDVVFVGDTLFMPDVGTARCDFPGGDAHTLYQSIRKLLTLPTYTRLFLCHDYPPEGRAPVWETTVAEQRRSNIHVRDGISEDEFVAMRKARDARLEMPSLILPSVQVNIRAGELPPSEDNGVRYLKIPINAI